MGCGAAGDEGRAGGKGGMGCGAGLALGVVLMGCAAPRPELKVSDPDPTIKIPAIKEAVQKKRTGEIDQMVKDLESDDPAVRFYAINGLERLTGHRFGYEYYATPRQRAVAVDRWKRWLNGREDRGGLESK